MRCVGFVLALAIIVALLVWYARSLARRDPPRGPEGDDTDAGPDPDYTLEIGDELDLHGVPPAEVEPLVVAFVEHARQRGTRRVKVIHGKGTGRLRARVHAILTAHPDVERFEDGLAGGSAWGATIVHVAPPSAVASDPPAD